MIMIITASYASAAIKVLNVAVFRREDFSLAISCLKNGTSFRITKYIFGTEFSGS